MPRHHAYSPVDSSAQQFSSGARLEPTRDVNVRERGPNFSAASYLDMLEFMSDSSGHSDAGDHSNSDDSDDTVPRPHSAPRLSAATAAPVPTFSSKAPRKVSAMDRGVVRTQSARSSRPKGYNYGVPSSRESGSGGPKSRIRSSGAKGLVMKDERIRVCVRKRPLSRREVRASDADIIEAQSTTTVVVKEPKVSVDLQNR